jgi:hypothetical protein
MKRKKIILVSTFFMIQAIFAMQEVSVDTTVGKKISKKMRVFNLLVAQDFLDQESICSFAATSKYCNKFVLNTAPYTANKLISCPKEGNCFGSFLHKYGSARYYAYSPDLSKLILGYHEIDKKKDKRCDFNFIAPLPHKPKPFLNKEGVLSIHAYSECLWNWGFGSFVNIKGIWSYGIDNLLRLCVIKVKDQEHWNLSCLVSYPALLEAVLCCSGKSEMVIMDPQIGPKKCMVYSFDDVMIPDNYNKRVEFPFGGCAEKKEGFYQNYPQYIKDVIEKRRQECVEQRALK